MKIVRLTPDYQFGSFDCGESDLNEFLLTDAKEYASHLLAVTYIIEDRNDIAAFFLSFKRSYIIVGKRQGNLATD